MPPLSRNRRATRRRANRTLSSYKIATKTSARAQARQIYALARRISSIQRRTRPETVVIQRTADLVDFATTYGTVSWFIQTSSSSSETTLIAPQLGPAINTTAGDIGSTAGVPNNFARLLTFTLYGDLRYGEYVNTNSPFTLRIVVIQTKSTRSSLSATDVFSPANTGNSAFAQVFGPLQLGLSRTARVLSDKRYTLSYQRPSVTIKTRLRYLDNFYRDTVSIDSGLESSDPVGKGAIYVMYASYTLSTALPSLRLMCKLAYSDA